MLNNINYNKISQALNKQECKRSLSFFVRHFFNVIDTAKYVHNWHIDLMCEYLQILATRYVTHDVAMRFEYKILTPLEIIELSTMRNLIINVPPGHMKSLILNVMFQSWLWLLAPETSFINASYANTLSLRDSRKMRALLESTEFKTICPEFDFQKDQKAKGYYINSKLGFRYSTSFSSGSTGHRANFICIDDPINATDALSIKKRESTNEHFDQQLYNRLNDMDYDCRVMIMQRLHDEDPTGHMLKKNTGEWVHLCLRATYDEGKPRSIGDRRKHGDLLFPQRFGEQVLADELKSKGVWGFAGQYQQDPVPKEGGIIKREYFNNSAVEIPCLMSDFYNIIQVWDMGFKKTATSDAIACAVVAHYNNQFYIVDIFKKRASFVESINLVKEVTELHPSTRHTIFIEDKANGTAIIESLRTGLSNYSITEIEAIDSKFARVQSIEPILCQHNLKILDTLKEQYIFDEYSKKEYTKYDLIVNDMCSFREDGGNDDLVDAITHALRHFKNNSNIWISDTRK
jgi:predicted phage terminase large subunit-like protein